MTDTQLLAQYQKVLKLAFNVMRRDHQVHYRSIEALSQDIGCKDTHTTLRLLQALKQKYNIRVYYDDDGLTIFNANTNIRH